MKIKSLQHLADIIEASYLKNLEKLDPITQRHFLYRLYLSNKSEQIRKKLINFGGEYTKKQTLYIRKFNTSYLEGLAKQKEDLNSIKAFYPHEEQRYKIWRKFPELVYFYTILRECFYLHFFNIPFSIDKERIKELVKLDINASPFIQNSSTHAICIIFYLDYLGLLPIVDEKNKWDYADIIIKKFSIDNNSQYAAIFNYLYALNHIVICDSYFYLKLPNKKLCDYGLVIDKCINRYYDLISLDLKVESLLSCLLLGQKKISFFDRVVTDIFDNFDTKLNIINSKKTPVITYKDSEHTNALCILIARINELVSTMGQQTI